MSDTSRDDHRDDRRDHDRTIDADDSELDRIRRLAAEAQAAGEALSPPLHADDRTAEADDSTLDQIRRLAAQAPARAEVLRDTPARDAPAVSPGVRPIPTTSIGDLVVEEAAPAPPTRPRAEADPWIPPPRSMRPERERDDGPDHARPWRLATAALAAVVIVLLAAWALFGRGTGTDDDPSPSVPGETVPAGVTVTAVLGEGGSGG